MAGRFEGKVAIVTGGGGGIGRPTAQLLAAEGAAVVVSDFGRDQSGRRFADLAVDEITTAGGRAVANYDSVITMAGGAAIVDAAVKAFGRVDVLVLPAGNYKERFLVDMTEEDWNLQINVNLNGHFTCIRAALPQLIKQRYGRIITVASRAAFGRPRGGMAYSAAKSAVMGRHCADVARAQAVRHHGELPAA